MGQNSSKFLSRVDSSVFPVHVRNLTHYYWLPAVGVASDASRLSLWVDHTELTDSMILSETEVSDGEPVLVEVL